MEGDAVIERSWISQSLAVVAAIALSLSFLRALLRVRKPLKGLRLPPCPPAWPVIGHFPIVGTLPHQSFHRLSQKYGPLMYLRLGARPALVASSAEMAKEILKTYDHVFASRHSSVQGEVIFYDHHDLICSPMGDNTRFLRKTCAVELFSVKRIQQFRGVRREEVLAGIGRILREGRHADPVNVGQRIEELTYNNVTRTLFGKSFYGQETVDSKSQEFLHMIDAYFRIQLLGLPDFFPYLRKLDLDGYEKTCRKLRTQVDGFLNRMIEEHRGKPEGSEDSDFTDVLLRLQGDSSSTDTQVLSDQGVKGLLFDLLLGGTDTSATQALWVLAELMKNPEVFKKVRSELDSVVGNERLVEETDLENLPYLRAVIKETMRLHPVGPITVPRKPVKAVTIGGYDIPDDCMVMVNVYSIMRDPNLWPDPLKFDPSRFLDSKIDHKGLHFEFLPFGSGRRMCPGMSLGMVMIEIVLAVLVHACDISLPAGMKPEHVSLDEENRSVVSMAHPIKIVVSPRLPRTVYSEAGMQL
ncbi:hypothetical protein Mapa_004135 [Marchantia paleacea]|nr:hypothetical protein Mapa_004135 [Marchantia paleacea]